MVLLGYGSSFFYYTQSRIDSTVGPNGNGTPRGLSFIVTNDDQTILQNFD